MRQNVLRQIQSVHIKRYVVFGESVLVRVCIRVSLIDGSLTALFSSLAVWLIKTEHTLNTKHATEFYETKIIVNILKLQQGSKKIGRIKK